MFDRNQLQGAYTVRVDRCRDDRQWFIARVSKDGEHLGFTQGTEQDIFYMLGDFLECAFEIQIPKWKRILTRLFNLP